MLWLIQLVVKASNKWYYGQKTMKTSICRQKQAKHSSSLDWVSIKASSLPGKVRTVCQKGVCWSCGGLFKINKGTCSGRRHRDSSLWCHKGCGTSIAERQQYSSFISLDGSTNPGLRKEVDWKGGRRDFRWKTAIRALTVSAGKKIVLCVLNYWCELVRTVYITSKAILHILFLGFTFFIKRASNLLFCYSDMGVEIGIMYVTYLLNFTVAFQLRLIA